MDTDGFLQQALIYLGAAIIAVPIFTRLGAGAVLGYLIAGIVIGPFGLGLITHAQTVLEFAELGIVLLLFLVGLELNAARVWQLRRAIFGLGGAQVVLTTAAIALVGYALGPPLIVGVVAGFGRFGQVVTRVLRGLGVRATVIDHDPQQIDTVRRFGWKAYYGDATRMDLLEAAGVRQAKLLLVAIDDPQAAMRLVKRVRARLPGLQLLVRAHSRTDAYEYAELGVPFVRELFAASLDAAGKLLLALGYTTGNAQRIISRFREYDERQIAESAPHRHDERKLIALTEQGRRDIAQLLAAEAALAPQVDENVTERDARRASAK